MLGTLVVTVPRRSARDGLDPVPERAARLTLRVRQVWIQPARKSQAEQRVWVLDAREEHPPDNVSGIHWVLLSTLPVTDLAEARTIVGYHAKRWVIERLHYTLKSGLQVEKLQIDDATSISHALAVLYVVAWRLMFLTLWARQAPDSAASAYWKKARSRRFRRQWGNRSRLPRR